ncbi:fimbria major subunit [Bacteroides coprosuis]|uniref:fimbria major subunit n=1 Tax=Bacteroides coprosuis TaxID=151276 RepID=UPI001DD0D7A9|nr:fimbria major subunit [Bacteroides coprosuis]HJD91721.1 fimbria major subunit [Bacteroides coprosuis]
MMKYLKHFFTLGLILIGAVACSRHIVEERHPSNKEESAYIRLHIGTSLGINSQNHRILEKPILEGDDKISEIEVYLLKKENGVYVNCREDNMPYFSKTYDKPMSEIFLYLDADLLGVGTYYVVTFANTSYLKQNIQEQISNLFDASGKFNVSHFYLYESDYMDTYPQSGQFPMSNSSTYISNDIEGFLDQYSFVITEDSKLENIELEVGLDRLMACVQINNEHPLPTSLELEEGLSLVYKDFATFNLYLGDYVFKHLKYTDESDIVIKKLSSSFIKKRNGWDVYYDEEWSNIMRLFSDRVKIIPENSPYYQSSIGKPTQGQATGVLIRVLGRKGGNDVSLYAKKKGDSYKLYGGIPSDVEKDSEDIIQYPQGMFYTFYLREPNLPLSSGQPHYGVVRNTAYILTIKAIDNLGGIKPFEDLPTPDEDSDIREAITNIEVHIQPWINVIINFE